MGVRNEAVAGLATDAAWEQAYIDHWTDAFRLALAWTNDLGDAEDLAQEAFVRLWRSRAGVDWSRPVLPWLLVTTRRLATDRFRRVRRWLGRTRQWDPPHAPDPEPWFDVQAAMARLSALERAAIVLTTIEGYPSAGAAELLGVSAGAVRSAASRARAKLEEA
jgi:RNA polymerase sigma-70 factor (ECF subfamily)